VRQLGHRDGLGHVHLEHLGFRLGRLVTVRALVAATAATTAPFGVGAPCGAAGTHGAGVATSAFDFFFLGRFVFPSGRQGFGFDFFLARPGSRSTRRGRFGGTGFGRCWCAGRFVQGALDSGLGLGHGGRLGLFGFFGQQHLFGGGHHVADRLRLGQRLAPALVEVARALLVGQPLRRLALRQLGGLLRGLLGCLLDSLRSGLLRCSGLLGHRRAGLVGCRHSRRFGRHGLGQLDRALAALLHLHVGAGALLHQLLLALLVEGGRALLRLARLALLALLPRLALLRQLFFLEPNLLGLLARLLFAPLELGLLRLLRAGFGGLGFGGGCNSGGLGGCDRALGRARAGERLVVAAHEGAFFTHLDLDRARAPGGIGLLDLAGRFFGEGDFVALGAGRAVAGLQKAQQPLLVGLCQRIAAGQLAHPGRSQLLQHDVGGPVQFSGKFCDGVA